MRLDRLGQCLNEGVESVLLLEDDAKFLPDFTARVSEFLEQLPDDWGMLYLGGQHRLINQAAPRMINACVYQPFSVNRTHSFALRGDAMRAVYRHLCTKDWSQGHHIDHHLERLHRKRRLPIYCPKIWLVGQARGRSNIAGRDFKQDRFWQPAQRLSEADPTGEPFVAVIGLHSSGSSCLAGVLHHLGLHLGNKFSGYWGRPPYFGFEAAGLAQLCERAIPFPASELRVKRGQAWRALRSWINQRRREARDLKTMAAGKYPQLCRLGDQLRSTCGEQLRVVHISRPLAESIESLQRRCPSKDAETLAAHQRWLWEGKQDLLGHIPADEQVTVEYAELLEAPQAQVDRLIKFLKIQPSDRQITKAIRHVDAGQRHVGG